MDHSLIHSFIHPFIYSSIQPPTNSFIQSCIHPSIHLLNKPFINPPSIYHSSIHHSPSTHHPFAIYSSFTIHPPSFHHPFTHPPTWGNTQYPPQRSPCREDLCEAWGTGHPHSGLFPAGWPISTQMWISVVGLDGWVG